MQRPRFDPTFNYGHLMQAGMLAFALVSAYAAFVSFRYEVRRDLRDLQAWSSVYRPAVDGLLRSQVVQDERIGNLADSIREIRKVNSDTLAGIAGMREELAGIKVRLPPPQR